MSIDIDGLDISGCTIDGVDVKEITIDGVSVWMSWDEMIYSGGNDETVKQINASNGSAGWTFTGHSSYVYAVAVSPDSNYLYSGSFDETVKQINASNGSAGWTFTGHSSSIYAVAVK